jgi:hypothetical protein
MEGYIYIYHVICLSLLVSMMLNGYVICHSLFHVYLHYLYIQISFLGEVLRLLLRGAVSAVRP